MNRYLIVLARLVALVALIVVTSGCGEGPVVAPGDQAKIASDQEVIGAFSAEGLSLREFGVGREGGLSSAAFVLDTQDLTFDEFAVTVFESIDDADEWVELSEAFEETVGQWPTPYYLQRGNVVVNYRSTTPLRVLQQIEAALNRLG